MVLPAATTFSTRKVLLSNSAGVPSRLSTSIVKGLPARACGSPGSKRWVLRVSFTTAVSCAKARGAKAPGAKACWPQRKASERTRTPMRRDLPGCGFIVVSNESPVGAGLKLEFELGVGAVALEIHEVERAAVSRCMAGDLA